METERDANLLVPAAVLGGCLLLGLVLGGWVLGAQIKDIKLADRYVTVKGLVERTVKSDMAIWPVSFKETGSDLPGVCEERGGQDGGAEVSCGARGDAAGDLGGADQGDR